MARYPGRNGVVYLSTTGSGTATTVIALTEWSVNSTTDKIDVTAFGDANKTYVQGLKDLQGTFSGFWDDTETKVFSAADSSDAVKLYLYPSSNKTNSYFYGTAWLDASMNIGVNGAVQISGSFAAASSWGRQNI
jgi:hypothetical protein